MAMGGQGVIAVILGEFVAMAAVMFALVEAGAWISTRLWKRKELK